ncbi:MAG: hypothetical protein U9N59_14965 [Campylobacterota bacterium]|nr:hypothetical protein [Campylobacterota bacterium]
MIEQLDIVIGLVIVVVWVFSIVNIKKLNDKKLKDYENNIEKHIFDEYSEPISSGHTPGILMSIGIIGTFILIFLGLSSIPDTLDIAKVLEVMKEKIAPAFLVSAFGILMSIVYTFSEKLFILNSYKKKIEFIKSNNTKTKTYESISSEQLYTTKLILNATEAQTKTFQSLSSFSDGLSDMTTSMSKFGEIATTLEKTLNPDVLGKVIAKAVNDEMSPILENIQSINENVNKNSNEIKQFLEVELKNDIIVPLKNSVDSSSDSMKNMEVVLKETSEVMNKTNKGFDKLNESLTKLESLQESFVTKLDGVLDKQKEEFEQTTQKINDTYNNLTESVNNQADKFNENSQKITNDFNNISTKMEEFFNGYKKEYEEMLSRQNEAIEKTSNKAIEALDSSKNMIENAGSEASRVITNASEQIGSTLDGVDEALVKTSQTVQKELEDFRDSYTEKVSEFLGKQVDVLEEVIGKQTVELSAVVSSFKDNLKEDVNNRRGLNAELDKLIKQTDGFVSDTKSMIAAGWDTQHQQLKNFMTTNKSMEANLSNLIDNATDINKNGNSLTDKLIDTTANLSKQFNDTQKEILEKYQNEVDKNLTDILGAMMNIIEISHMTKDEK